MSIYKVPKGVLHELESIRSKFFNAIDPLERKIIWIAWEKVLASKKNRGLGVSILFALNRALLLKWVWRFLSNDGSLWSQVIKAIYGSSFETHYVKYSSTWCSILREVQVFSGKGFDFVSHVKKRVGFDFVSHVKKRVGNGQNTKSWLDTWIFDSPLSVRFPRLFALDSDKQVSVASKWAASGFNASFRCEIRDGVERQQWTDMLSILGTVILSPSFNRWICDLNGDGTFRVKDIHAILDDMFLPSASEPT
nr:RNA-directed DNA polymerase, eukaryota, reverse transcriptase zinc-binding domain protein [Tanacetum cinerariifolium]